MLYSRTEEIIGNTPLVKLTRYLSARGIAGNVYGKLEGVNPSGSAKDRAALFMIDEAEKSGTLAAGGTIIEPTSGNTGIGLAAIGAARGYRVILVMPDTMSQERIRLLKAYGAQVVLTPGSEGMKGSIARAEELREAILGAVLAGQFDNPANPLAHEKTTGPEIWKDLGGKVDVFVAGAGTGGTITGTAKYLKKQNPDIKIVAVEPASSPLLTEGRAGAHGLQGIGANFVPKNLDLSLVDEIMTVTDEDAFASAKLLARSEGLLTGITSGAAAYAAGELAKKYPDANIVALLPDNGDRYLSTGIYD